MAFGCVKYNKPRMKCQGKKKDIIDRTGAGDRGRGNRDRANEIVGGHRNDTANT